MGEYIPEQPPERLNAFPLLLLRNQNSLRDIAQLRAFSDKP